MSYSSRSGGAVAFLDGIRPSGPILDISDTHIGDGGASDDFYEEGALWLLETGMLYRPAVIAFKGDIFERWQAKLRKILEAHKDFFRAAERIILSVPERPAILPIAGNHDPDIEETFLALREVMPSLEYVPPAYGSDMVDLFGWRLCHGHQFDEWNRKGPWRPIARGATWLAGQLERAFGGLEEGYLNPQSWVSPAHDYTKSIKGHIDQSVFEYSIANKVKVSYGHTHEPDISRDRTIVNCGCCCNKRASAAVLFPDGNANLIERMQ